MHRRSAASLVWALLLVPAIGVGADKATVDQSASSKELAAIQRVPGQRMVVAIYEVHSAVPEIQAPAAQDMFVTALVKSGVFAVAERSRLAEGVMRERQLQSSGVSDGAPAGQVAAARYVFEVTISEANRDSNSGNTSVSVAGLEVGGGHAGDQIGLDVRIIDVQTGLVVDAVNTVKEIEARTTRVSGVGNFLNSMGGLQGRQLPVPVDANNTSTRREGVDRALRSCIEVAVAELARRMVSN